MKTATAFLAIFVLLALPMEAAVKTCNAARVTAGDCVSTSQTLLLFPIATTALIELQDEVCERFGYPVIVCAAADVTAGRCATAQLGQAVNTPETRAAFANRMLGELLRNFVRDRRVRSAQEAARTSVSDPPAIEP